MYQEYCGANPEKCLAYCRVAGLATRCKEFIGLNPDGTFVALGPDGLPMNATALAAQQTKATVTKTTFTVDVAIATAADFSDTSYLEELAKTTGVPAADISIENKTFLIEVAYEFTGSAITESQAKTAIATDWGVSEDNLTVTLSVLSATSRRMHSSSRRLSGTKTQVTAQLKTTNVTQADVVMTKAATTTGVVSNLDAAGVTVTATVKDAPSLYVKVATKVLSKVPIAQPSPAQLNAVAVASGGTGATLDKSSWKTEEVDDTRPSKATASLASRFRPQMVLAALLAMTVTRSSWMA